MDKTTMGDNLNNRPEEKLIIETPEQLKIAVLELYEIFHELSGKSLETNPLVRYIRLDDVTAEDIRIQYGNLKAEDREAFDLKGPVNVEFDYLSQEERRKFAQRKPYFKIKFTRTTEGDPLINVQLRLTDGYYNDMDKVLEGAHYLTNSFIKENNEASSAKSLEELHTIMDNLGHKDLFVELISKLYTDASSSTSRKQLNEKK